MIKLAIIGSRTATDYDLLCRVLGEHYGYRDPFWGAHIPHATMTYRIGEVISGGANGADKLGARWAKEHNIKLTEYIPDWDLYGKRAGFLRNETIIADCDEVLALWDSVSKGTRHSLSLAHKARKPMTIIYV